ncbi:aminotransferase class V-fold PLP-dependent enzyme [Streptomyces sp. NPDC006743]|uniref:pyridoxal phosphate-dependent decarboxylase family protein n=1 Tax=Streptomyces sp. NPDC006743 TaxID=3154480 RepID=UPI0034572AF7
MGIPPHLPLEVTSEEVRELGEMMVSRLAEFVREVPGRPAGPAPHGESVTELVAPFTAAPPEEGGDLSALLDRLCEAAGLAMETAGPRVMAAIPGGGIYVSALAEFFTRTVNRFGGLAAAAPALTAMEESVLRWMAQDVCGLPAGSSGILTTGGSMANLSAVVAARHSRLGECLENGTLYLGAQTHHSVAKAARIAGIREHNVRLVPTTDRLHLDVAAAARMIRSDRRAGLRPFLLVATAGTTDAGVIDPLDDLAALAAEEDVWFHVDAAYGGFFRLTERGRRRLAGTKRADSVTLDPHKTLFLPFGTGALVVRDPAALTAAHQGTGSVLQDVGSFEALPDYAYRGVELSRENRGTRVWLPLHLHGVSAFCRALDEKLDLAEYAYEKLTGMPELEVPLRPELSTVTFRVRPRDASPEAVREADEATRRLPRRINASGRVLIYSTVVEGRQTVRMCVVAYATHKEHVDEALEETAAAVAAL